MHNVVTQIEQRIKSTFLLAPKIPYIIDEIVETEGLRERIGWCMNWESALEKEMRPIR